MENKIHVVVPIWKGLLNSGDGNLVKAFRSELNARRYAVERAGALELELNEDGEIQYNEATDSEVRQFIIELDDEEWFDEANFTGDPEYNWNNDDGQEGMMETFSPHKDRVFDLYKVDPQRVWTILHDDEGNDWVSPGLHYVNRICYFVSNERWEDPEKDYVWSKSEDNEDEEDEDE